MSDAVNTRRYGRPVTHGLSSSPTYAVWANIRQACLNPKATGYRTTGGMGIRVCERWSKFAHFLEDMGEKPDGTVLKRRDTTKDYSPENCYWQEKD